MDQAAYHQIAVSSRTERLIVEGEGERERERYLVSEAVLGRVDGWKICVRGRERGWSSEIQRDRDGEFGFLLRAGERKEGTERIVFMRRSDASCFGFGFGFGLRLCRKVCFALVLRGLFGERGGNEGGGRVKEGCLREFERVSRVRRVRRKGKGAKLTRR